MEQETEDAITVTLRVPVAPEAAFDAFVDGFATWYPREYTWAGEALTWIGFEARVGGSCFDLGPHGFRCDWGRVLALEPGRRLKFTWQIGYDRVPVPDSARASEIEVTWTAAGADTVVAFTHREFQRHGEQWRAYRAALAAPGGWSYILGRYSDALRGAR